MGSPIALSDMDPLLDLVLRETPGPHHRLHLGTRDFAPLAHGSIDELCLEVHAAHGPGGRGVSRSLALLAPGCDAMVGEYGVACGGLCAAGPRSREQKQNCETNLSFC